ncbi:MAG: GDSL-type esterase/lipase family protein [Chloroflexota bacterium]
MNDIRICFIGDSFTQGTGDELYLGWPGRVCASARARGHAVTSYNLGIRRETTTDIRARWRAEVTPRLVAGVDGRIVFSFGANDATIEDDQWRVPAALSVENLRAMLARATLSHSVLVVGPPPAPEPDRTERHAELASRYAQACAAFGVPFLDVLEPLKSAEGWWEEVAAGDGIHPGRRGYDALAALVEAWPAWRAWLP